MGSGCTAQCGWTVDLASFHETHQWDSGGPVMYGSSYKRRGTHFSSACGLAASEIFPTFYYGIGFGRPSVSMGGINWYQPASFQSQTMSWGGATWEDDGWFGRNASAWHTTAWSGSGPLLPATFGL